MQYSKRFLIALVTTATFLASVAVSFVQASTTHSVQQLVQSSSEDFWPALTKSFRLGSRAFPHEVKSYLRWYIHHPQHLQRGLVHAKYAIQYIWSEVQARNMPGEIALIPFIESNYDPYAYSRKGAAGIWQMMPATAASFDLKTNWWFDARRDLVQSTEAALDYLEQLHKQFHSWPLAIAAYDVGPGAIRRAMKKRHHAVANLASIDLPKETRQYIPRLFALATLFSYADHYHLKLPKLENSPYFSGVSLQRQLTRDQITKLSGVDRLVVRALNPGLRRFATPPHERYHLLLPEAAMSHFKTELLNLPKVKSIAWDYHQVRAGETLSSIAKNHHMSEERLASVNHLEDSAIKVGWGLLVPLRVTQKNQRPFRVEKKKQRKVKVKQKSRFTHHDETRILKTDSLKTIINKAYSSS